MKLCVVSHVVVASVGLISVVNFMYMCVACWCIRVRFIVMCFAWLVLVLYIVLLGVVCIKMRRCIVISMCIDMCVCVFVVINFIIVRFRRMSCYDY